MVTPIPLHPQAPQPEEPLDNPDVLILNALLASGEWNPESHGLSKDMLGSHHQAWAFCQDYQDKTGGPPSVQHFARSFPTIEMLGGVSVEWAAGKVRQQHYERQMRRSLMGAIASLNAGDFEAARTSLLEVTAPSPTGKPQGLNVYDAGSVSEETVKVGWDTHWGRLKAVTGGPGRGELWYLAARLGQGKSWMAACMAVAAARHGARVAIASVEMPMVEYTQRIHSLLTENDPELQRALRGPDEQMRQAALAAVTPMPGSIEVFDPSVLRMNLTGIETLCAQYDVVIPDHVGLLADTNNRKSMEDWRVAGTISNTLREYSLRYHMSIIGVLQVNREGETSTDAPPKVSQLSQSDAFGQDGQVIITYKRMGERAMKHYVAKNRNGRGDTFYTRYLPGVGDFSEISQDEARAIQLEDKDRAASA